MALKLRTKGDTSSKRKSRELLEWNQMKTLSHLLAMEEHLSELSSEEVTHSWCLVKHHLLGSQHHVFEAVGHAERAGVDPEPYRRFKQKMEDLNVYPQPHVSIKDLVKLRTEWRIIIKDPTLTGDCPTCSLDVADIPQLGEFLKKRLNNPKSFYSNKNPNIGEKRKMAKQALRDVSVNAVLGVVAGAGGLAIHFLGFAPHLDQYNVMGVAGSVIADLVGGLIMIAVGTTMKVPDWLQSILLVAGGTLMGVGLTHALGWQAYQVPVPRPTALPRVTQPYMVQPTVVG